MAARTVGGIIQTMAPNAARTLTKTSEAARTLYKGAFTPRALQSYEQLEQGLQPTAGSRFIKFLRGTGTEDMIDTLRAARRDTAATGGRLPASGTSMLLRRAQQGDTQLSNAFAHIMRAGAGFLIGHMTAGEGMVGAVMSELGHLMPGVRAAQDTIGSGAQKALTFALTNRAVAPLTKALLNADPRLPAYGKLAAVLAMRLFPSVRALANPDPQGLPPPGPSLPPGASSQPPGALGGGLSGILGVAGSQGLLTPAPQPPPTPAPGAGAPPQIPSYLGSGAPGR